jgi:hypothetical protein
MNKWLVKVSSSLLEFLFVKRAAKNQLLDITKLVIVPTNVNVQHIMQ